MKIGKTLNGIVVYEILPDGCLNGVYSNTHKDTKNQIFNEMARKNSLFDEDKIDGIYACSNIDLANLVYTCELDIANTNNQYTLKWYEITSKRNRILKFEGIGWRTRKNQLTVMYWD
ncbi:MAG: hypothetical protein JWP37_2613 [Mucilaginibacter sp.]|nr:hypothetical protein [Mucilaginibacter sp.]